MPSCEENIRLRSGRGTSLRMNRAIGLPLLFLMSLPAVHAQSRLTLWTSFDQVQDPIILDWTERETADLFSDAGVKLIWEQAKNSTGQPVPGVPVLVHFRGSCRWELNTSWPTPGSLATTQMQEGDIQPVIEVDCDRAAGMLWQERNLLPRPLVMRAFGRALGRVLAHELYHYVTQTSVHGTSVLFRPKLSARDLTKENMRFEPFEIQALQRGMIERSVVETTLPPSRSVSDDVPAQH